MLLNINGIVRINKKTLAYLPSGSAILKMSCVSSEKFKGKDGNEVDNTCWIDVVGFAKQAEIVDKFFQEKDRIYITGKLNQDTWEKEGQKFSKHTIKLESFEFVESKNNQSQTRQEPKIVYENRNTPDIEIDEDDIGF